MSDRCPQCGEVPNPDGQCACTKPEETRSVFANTESVFLTNLHYFYAQTDGTYRWPEGAVGDLLKQAKKELETGLSGKLEDDQQAIRAKLDAFAAKHGVWQATQLLLVELADRQRKEGKIKSADYTGDDFHISVKLKSR